MPVIAMTREMGSGGREIAQRVADKMGLTVILHELVEHDLAEHMHVRDSAIHHRLEGGATLRERWQIGSKRLARYTAEEILDLAKQGNVLIRGWGACVVLRDVPHVARVRVCTPMEARERAVMERSGLKDRSAAQARNRTQRRCPQAHLASRLWRRPGGPPALRPGAEHRSQLDRDLCEARLRSR